ncbi:hypothetical protein [Frankia sp. CcI49]|uniref:hypothetical protein n=1 Tax=Frankia sp. CcI49 TaxID=1745382 RepID=UPI001056D080|nr:hypothetical protein [Frankia sp. CcI49]
MSASTAAQPTHSEEKATQACSGPPARIASYGRGPEAFTAGHGKPVVTDGLECRVVDLLEERVVEELAGVRRGVLLQRGRCLLPSKKERFRLLQRPKSFFLAHRQAIWRPVCRYWHELAPRGAKRRHAAA